MNEDNSVGVSNEEINESALCRVCHCEGDDNNPLYFPCKCDGSIKFVHEKCLLEWLRVKGQGLHEAKCELCGEKFGFKNVYTIGDGLIPQLGAKEFFFEAISRIVAFLGSRNAKYAVLAVCFPLVVGKCFNSLRENFIDIAVAKGYFRPDPGYDDVATIPQTMIQFILFEAFEIVRIIFRGFFIFSVVFSLVAFGMSAYDQCNQIYTSFRVQALLRMQLDQRIEIFRGGQLAPPLFHDDLDGEEETDPEDNAEDDSVAELGDENSDEEIYNEIETAVQLESNVDIEEVHPDEAKLHGDLATIRAVDPSVDFVEGQSEAPGAGALCAEQDYAVSIVPKLKIGEEQSVEALGEMNEPLEVTSSENETQEFLGFSPEPLKGEIECSTDPEARAVDMIADISTDKGGLSALSKVVDLVASGIDKYVETGIFTQSDIPLEFPDDLADKSALDDFYRLLVHHSDLRVHKDNSNSSAGNGEFLLSAIEFRRDKFLVELSAVKQTLTEEKLPENCVYGIFELGLKTSFQRYSSSSRSGAEVVAANMLRTKYLAIFRYLLLVYFLKQEIWIDIHRLHRGIFDAEQIPREVMPLGIPTGSPDFLTDSRQDISNTTPEVFNIAERPPNDTPGDVNPGVQVDAPIDEPIRNEPLRPNIIDLPQIIDAAADPVAALIPRGRPPEGINFNDHELENVSWQFVGILCSTALLAMLVVLGLRRLGEDIVAVMIPQSVLEELESEIAIAMEKQYDLVYNVNRFFKIVPEKFIFDAKAVYGAFRLYLELAASFTAIGAYAILHVTMHVSLRFLSDIPLHIMMCKLLVSHVLMESKTMMKWFKSMNLIFFDLIVFGHLIGWLIGLSTMRLIGTSFNERIEVCVANPITCGMIHWIVGALFTAHVASLLYWTMTSVDRTVLNRTLCRHLEFFDGDFESVLNLYLDGSWSYHIQRILLNVCIMIPALIFLVIIPTRFGHFLLPGAEPLKPRFQLTGSDLQSSIELVTFHVVLPFAAERMHGDVTKSLVGVLLRLSCWLTGLDEVLIKPPAVPVVGGRLANPHPVVNLFDDQLNENLLQGPLLHEQNLPIQDVQAVEHLPPEVPIPDHVQGQSEVANDQALESYQAEDHVLQEPPLHDQDPAVRPIQTLEQIFPEGEIFEPVQGHFQDTNGHAHESFQHSASETAFVNGDLVVENQVGFDIKSSIANDIDRRDCNDCIGCEVNTFKEKSEMVDASSTKTTSSEYEDSLEATRELHIQGTIENLPDDSTTPLTSKQIQVKSRRIRDWSCALVGLVLLVILYSYIWRLPLAIGRRIMKYLRFPEGNDFYNFCVGGLLLWLCGRATSILAADLNRMDDFYRGIRTATTWCKRTIIFIVVAGFWITIPPLLTGLLFDLVLMHPLQFPLHETPRSPLFPAWSVGLVFLKLWCKLVHNGIFGEIEMMFHFFRIIRRGFSEFDAVDTVVNVVIPVTTVLLDLVLIPFFLSRLLAVFILTDSYYNQTLVARYSHLTFVLLLLLIQLVQYFGNKLVLFYQTVRDARYLVRAELANR